MGIGKDGHHKAGFARGMELRAKYTLFAEGARGSLSKVLIAKFGLANSRQPQKYGIGIKELWQVAPENFQRRARAAHAWAGRSATAPAAVRSFTISAIISWRSASSSTSTTKSVSVAVRGVPALQDASASARHIHDGKRICYGARAVTEGGWQSVPKLVFPGGALVGCAAGFMNLPRIKGSHNAILSGMLAAESVAAALAARTLA